MNATSRPQGHPSDKARGASRRAVLAGAAMLCMLGAGAASAEEDFPSKPITIIAHTGAGSSTDIFARELARAAEPLLGQPIVIENRPGGSGAAQMSALKLAKPNGYTIGVNTLSHLTAMQTNLKGSFAWDDFSWIVLNQLDPYAIVVRSDSEYKTLKDLVEDAKKKGGTLNVGGFGTVGSAHNIAFNLFADAAGFKFNWVPFEGGSQAMTALLGGHIDVVNTNPGPMLQFAEANRVRPLGVLSKTRIDSMPDTPTLAEAGYDLGTTWQQIRGIYGPKGIPMDIQKKLADAFLQAMKRPEFVKYMKASGQIAGDLGPEEYTAFIAEQNELAKTWLDKLGATQ